MEFVELSNKAIGWPWKCIKLAGVLTGLFLNVNIIELKDGIQRFEL
jgi:hypothetical protein